MNSRHLAASILLAGLVLMPERGAAKAKPTPSEEEVVKLSPFVVEASSLASAGFTFKARFRPHMMGAGIKELIIVEVGPQSEAKKAGLAVGERILQIRDVKVEGLRLDELQTEFAAQAVDGKVPLVIQSKGSNETRTVVLQFKDSASKKAAAQPSPPAAKSEKPAAN